MAFQQTTPKFEGWHALAEDSIEGKFEWKEFEPKAFAEDDVEIKVQYCGICASDLHTASGGWGAVDYPQIVGHELVGIATRVGSQISHVKVGDLVGVGAQSDSCLECEYCKGDREPYCNKGQVGTYGGKFYRDGPGKGSKSYGGYSLAWRGPGHFVIPIPDGLDPAVAAPMLCGGVTVYSPLKQYGAGKTAKDVGIVGIGGLGHFGLLFAKALGANVTAISHSESKKADAEKMGVSRFIATHGGEDAFKAHARSLDLIVATTNDQNMPLEGYLTLLRPGGQFILVGAPEKPLPTITPFQLIMHNVAIGGSLIGSPATIKEMLALAAKQDVKSWIQKRDMKDANQAVVDMHNSKARYRFVLVNTDNGGKLE
ncbi:hypothetical protein JCM8097_003881 [Rhodosporidiobolus ruineniae]